MQNTGLYNLKKLVKMAAALDGVFGTSFALPPVC
jgi:hypothetical protein